jgi:stage V sporulation protein SpoVS
MVPDIANLKKLSSEYLLDELRHAFIASKEQIRALLISAMYVPIRAPGIIDRLLQAIEAGNFNAAVEAIQNGGGSVEGTLSSMVKMPTNTNTNINTKKKTNKRTNTNTKTKSPNIVDRIIDLYMSVENREVAFNLLRYMIFFNNPTGLLTFITSVDELFNNTPPAEINTRINSLLPSCIWTAVSI